MRFNVIGHAFIPVKVRIEIEAKTREEAMTKANRKLKRGGIREYIVAGSEDEGATFDFDAFDAEMITKPKINYGND
jgi:hypothetical protein